MGRNCATGLFMILLICFCFDIVNVNARFPYLREVVTRMELYMHHVVSAGKNAMAVQVAPQEPMKLSGGVSYSGPVYVIDNPLTETPDPKSRLLGTAQGLYSMSSHGEFSLLTAMSYSLDGGKNKGNALSVAGKFMPLREQRELSVVGGIGRFRMGRGYAIAHTHSIQGPNAVIRFNVTVFHYAP